MKAIAAMNRAVPFALGTGNQLAMQQKEPMAMTEGTEHESSEFV